jgi:hypothetical protein
MEFWLRKIHASGGNLQIDLRLTPPSVVHVHHGRSGRLPMCRQGRMYRPSPRRAILAADRTVS